MWHMNLYPEIYFSNGIQRPLGINKAIKYINPIEQIETLQNLIKKDEAVNKNVETILRTNELEKQFETSANIEGSGMSGKYMKRKPHFSFSSNPVRVAPPINRGRGMTRRKSEMQSNSLFLRAGGTEDRSSVLSTRIPRNKYT